MALPRRSLQVLVVDDSAVVRRVLSTVLEAQPDMAVATASDPVIAMRKMVEQRPDVIVLDIDMPRMDGLTFLSRIMADDPIPVVICSGHARKGSSTAVQALSQGAVDIVAKPSYGIGEFLQKSAGLLVETVRGAAQAKLRPRTPAEPPPRNSADVVLRRPGPGGRSLDTRVLVAIGASTGGPEALRLVLGAMPRECPPIVAVQHMQEGFTRAYAELLDQCCTIEVREAEEGDRLRPGRALIAPGDRHLMLAGNGEHLWTRLVDGPLVSRHRPSVDVLFRSVAQVAGPSGIGVIMTGMGDDGAEGLLEMRQAGAATMAQDQASCVVFGMPKEAIGRNAAAETVALENIPGWISRKVRERDARKKSSVDRDREEP